MKRWCPTLTETENKTKNVKPKKKNSQSALKSLVTLGDYFKNIPEFSALYDKLNKHKRYYHKKSSIAHQVKKDDN